MLQLLSNEAARLNQAAPFARAPEEAGLAYYTHTVVASRVDREGWISVG